MSRNADNFEAVFARWSGLWLMWLGVVNVKRESDYSINSSIQIWVPKYFRLSSVNRKTYFWKKICIDGRVITWVLTQNQQSGWLAGGFSLCKAFIIKKNKQLTNTKRHAQDTCKANPVQGSLLIRLWSGRSLYIIMFACKHCNCLFCNFARRVKVVCKEHDYFHPMKVLRNFKIHLIFPVWWRVLELGTPPYLLRGYRMKQLRK